MLCMQLTDWCSRTIETAQKHFQQSMATAVSARASKHALHGNARGTQPSTRSHRPTTHTRNLYSLCTLTHTHTHAHAPCMCRAYTALLGGVAHHNAPPATHCICSECMSDTLNRVPTSVAPAHKAMGGQLALLHSRTTHTCHVSVAVHW